MSNEQARFCDETELLPEQIAATIEREWGAVADAPTPIDATISTRAVEEAAPPQDVIVPRRRVHHHGQPGPGDGEYDLIHVLGRGGMGVVYQATQACIGRSVAVKMLKAGNDGGSTLRQKFIEEAAVTGKLDHPNIVPIYDLGQTADGLLFYAMKQVRGTPWKEVLGQRTVAENLRILMRVADAVAFAHSRGVVHRDLKPENIMLGEFGEVLVMDWGLALVTTGHGHRTITMGGTPCYMAPEMVTGPPDAIGPRSDIYLLGAILYEIVTGAAPHAGAGVPQCLLAAAQNEITPARESGELVQIALRALATVPADRFSAVQEFQAAVGEYQSHTESIAAAARARQGLAQARALDDYDGFARALFDFQNALALWDGNAAARTGVSETRVAYAESALAKGDYDLGLSTLAAEADDHLELQQKLRAAQQERDARRQRLRRVRRTAVGLAVGLVVVMAVALVWIMKADEAYQHAATLFEQLARDFPDALEYRRQLARSQDSLGELYRTLGKSGQAEALYLDALDRRRALTRRAPGDAQFRQELARTHYNLGLLYWSLNRPDEARTAYDSAIAELDSLLAAERADAEYRHELARALQNRGSLNRGTGQVAAARQDYDRAIGLLSALTTADRRNAEYRYELATALNNLGNLLLSDETQRDKTQQVYRDGVELLESLTEDFPSILLYRKELANSVNSLAALFYFNQDFDAAERLWQRSRGLEPGILLYQQVGRFTLEAELRDWIPIDGTEGRQGNIIRYGVGASTDLCSLGLPRVRPVVELAGWTVLDGQTRFLSPTGVVVQDADGDTIVNAKIGSRFMLGQNHDVYVGYGRSLTGNRWYEEILRAELRFRY